MSKPPRVLIEEWLPAAAIGVECMRERGTGQNPPNARFHVWWARRPLTAARAAVLGSLLPADFPRDVFERLLGFGVPGAELVEIRRILDAKTPGTHIDLGFECDRAFKHVLREDDFRLAHQSTTSLWNKPITVVDPMAGGGSIPLESARLGFNTIANEYNPVACSVLEATVDYPFRFGTELGRKARRWAVVWEQRVSKRLSPYYHERQSGAVKDYIFARTVPCPDTQFATPLVPDWHLLKPKSGLRLAAEPVVDRVNGTWNVRIREIGNAAGQLREPPRPTYGDGKGVSLFTGGQISSEYIKAMAQQGQMRSALYAVAVKSPKLTFQPPLPEDLAALAAAAEELARQRPGWERAGIIPTERVPVGDKTGELFSRGVTNWADMFSPRQLLAMGVLVEELRNLRPEIVAAEGEALGEAVIHLLALAVDKFANWNAVLSSWNAPYGTMRSIFDRHDYAFKPTFAEMAPCNAGAGLQWAIDNVLEAYEELAKLPRHHSAAPVEVTLGTATNLPQIADGSVTACVVDPPYADNVQYSELADFFYVWLKRTQGHHRPEWFSTYLCEHDQEAVVNISRHRQNGGKTALARAEAHAFYQGMMTETFREYRRILRDDGVLTVMFTHKKQEAWEALFASLIQAGFTIGATWPVKTESEHSLNQANKNAAQSTVILVSRKRPASAGIGYFDNAMRHEIRQKARDAAARLQAEDLNPIDQLVGSFGPAMEVYSRYDEVRTDTGLPVGVGQAIDEASDAVSAWRIEQLAARGLDGVEPEGRFALLCWDIMGAYEFRFNEASLLGKAVGMDVDQLIVAGLVSKNGDKIKMLSARERRRERALDPDEVVDTLFGPIVVGKRHAKREVLKVHPNDSQFRTALDACHALALRYIETGADAGVGSSRALAHQQRWAKDSAVARLMEALVVAAPEAIRYDRGPNSAGARFQEFRVWHSLLQPIFGIEPPDWTEKPPLKPLLPGFGDEYEEEEEDEEE